MVFPKQGFKRFSGPTQSNRWLLCKVNIPFGIGNRKKKSCRPWKNSELALFPLVRWVRDFLRERSTKIQNLNRRIFAALFRDLPTKTGKRTRYWLICSQDSPGKRRRHQLR